MGKDSSCHAGGTGGAGLVLESGGPPGGGRGGPLRYSRLETPGQGTLAATVLELADSDTTQQARRQEKRLVRSACGGAGSVPGAAWRQAAALATRHPRHTLTPSRTRSLVSASAHL